MIEDIDEFDFVIGSVFNKLVGQVNALTRELEAIKGSAISGSKDFDKEFEFIKNLDAKSIAKRYNKTNDNKNGFSTLGLYKKLGGTNSRLSEIKMAEFIQKMNK